MGTAGKLSCGPLTLLKEGPVICFFPFIMCQLCANMANMAKWDLPFSCSWWEAYGAHLQCRKEAAAKEFKESSKEEEAEEEGPK